MGTVSDTAAEYLNGEDREEVDQAADEQAHQAKSKRVEEVEESEKIDASTAEQLAGELWTFIDGLATHFGGPKYKQKESDHAVLVGVTAPVMQKRIPKGFGLEKLKDLVPLEVWMLGGIALVYVPKYAADEAPAPSTTAPGAPGEPASPSPTVNNPSAPPGQQTVDGSLRVVR